MGCDIHLYVEKFVDDKWVTADTWEIDKYNCKFVPYEKEFYSERNYDLFAILANVRNGYGFAGVETGSGFVPISSPKGLPIDVCEEVKKESDDWNGDGHSHSWYTLKDILEYDWTRRTKKCGYLNALGFFKWDFNRREFGNPPESWCGGVWGKDITIVQESTMKSMINDLFPKEEPYANKCKLIEDKLKNLYCKVEWKISYSSTCSYFWSDTIPRLLALGKPENVRIVFWFDN